MTCDTIGCVEEAAWRVSDEKRWKDVCRDCRDHLVVMGWRLERSVYRGAS